jgi:site-specific recombinase XerD
LTPDLVEIIERRREKHPSGYLFRNRDGRKWTDSAVLNTLKNLRQRLGLGSKMIPYSYRHTFATGWLLDGGSIKVLADLLGTSIAMIEKHYGHLEVDKPTMRKLLCDFRQRRLAQPTEG